MSWSKRLVANSNAGDEHHDRAARTDELLRRAQRAHVVLDVLEHVVRDDRGMRSLRCSCDVELAYRHPLVMLEPGPQLAEEMRIEPR